MPITDGWFNVFRLSAEDPVQDGGRPVDAVNAFFGDGSGAGWLATTLDDGLDAMRQSGAERALLTIGPGDARRAAGAHRPPIEFGDVEFGMEVCAREPDRFRLVLQLDDVSSPHAAARLVHEIGGLDQVVAVGVFPAHLGCDIDDRKLYPVYTACVEEGVPIRINVGIAGPLSPSRHQHPELLEDVLLDFPELRVLACHMGHPYEHLMMALLAKFPNLYLMTSAFLPKYFHPDLVRYMASSRGAGRVLFASDHPVIPLPRALEEARKLPLGEDALDQFLGTALCEVVGWQ